MKRLACEICGSTDLIKQDGVFVCQACGCKYSVEEARKMMIDGKVDVSGSSVIIDRSEEIENLIVLARRALKEGNYERANSHYDDILKIDPNNWEANFYRSYCTTMNSRIISVLSNFTTTVKTAQTSIDLLFKEDNINFNACSEIVNKVKELASLVFINKDLSRNNHIILNRSDDVIPLSKRF